MNELDLDSFEISIQSDIKAIKPKIKRRGYTKELVQKLHPTIEQALADGCSIEQIAEVLLQRNIKISSATLKKYYKANKKTKKLNTQNSHDFEKKQQRNENTNLNLSKLDSATKQNATNEVSKSSQTKEVSVSNNENQNLVSNILLNSALTEEDYADDFNDY